MIYKISITNSVPKITKESSVSRPIEAYMDGQVEQNVVFAVVEKQDGKTLGEILNIKLVDMNVKPFVRALFPVVTIAGNYEYVKNNLSKKFAIRIDTNLGSFKIHNTLREESEYQNCNAGTALMQLIWTKGIPILFTSIKLIQEEYCRQKSVLHKPWIMELSKEDIQEFKVFLKEQLGK